MILTVMMMMKMAKMGIGIWELDVVIIFHIAQSTYRYTNISTHNRLQATMQGA